MRRATLRLYHCTYAKNLSAIARRGLIPGLSGGLLRAVQGNNLRGVYLTAWEGVRFWMGRLEAWAEHDYDYPADEGLVPVVLRVETACPVVPDALGTRDAAAAAVVCPRPIAPGALRVWDGGAWIAARAAAARGEDYWLALGSEVDGDGDSSWRVLLGTRSALLPMDP